MGDRVDSYVRVRKRHRGEADVLRAELHNVQQTLQQLREERASLLLASSGLDTTALQSFFRSPAYATFQSVFDLLRSSSQARALLRNLPRAAEDGSWNSPWPVLPSGAVPGVDGSGSGGVGGQQRPSAFADPGGEPGMPPLAQAAARGGAPRPPHSRSAAAAAAATGPGAHYETGECTITLLLSTSILSAGHAPLQSSALSVTASPVLPDYASVLGLSPGATMPPYFAARPVHSEHHILRTALQSLHTVPNIVGGDWGGVVQVGDRMTLQARHGALLCQVLVRAPYGHARSIVVGALNGEGAAISLHTRRCTATAAVTKVGPRTRCA